MFSDMLSGAEPVPCGAASWGSRFKLQPEVCHLMKFIWLSDVLLVERESAKSLNKIFKKISYTFLYSFIGPAGEFYI